MKKFLLPAFAALLLLASCSSNDTYYFKISAVTNLSNGKESELMQYVESKVNLKKDWIYQVPTLTEASNLAKKDFDAEIADIDEGTLKSYLSDGDNFTLSLKMWAPESQLITQKKWSK